MEMNLEQLLLLKNFEELTVSEKEYALKTLSEKEYRDCRLVLTLSVQGFRKEFKRIEINPDIESALKKAFNMKHVNKKWSKSYFNFFIPVYKPALALAMFVFVVFLIGLLKQAPNPVTRNEIKKNMESKFGSSAKIHYNPIANHILDKKVNDTIKKSRVEKKGDARFEINKEHLKSVKEYLLGSEIGYNEICSEPFSDEMQEALQKITISPICLDTKILIPDVIDREINLQKE